MWNVTFKTPQIRKDSILTFIILDKHPTGDVELVTFQTSPLAYIENTSSPNEITCQSIGLNSQFCLRIIWEPY